MAGRDPRAYARPLLLVAALALVALVHATPHWDVLNGRDARVPVHMDEYVHWGYAKATLRDGTVSFGDPFSGREERPFSAAEHLHEHGFLAFLAAFQDLSGLPWTTLLSILPIAVALLLGLVVYAFAEPWGAGVEACFWLAAVPTTLRFLGPGFAVPLAFSAPLIFLALYLVAHRRGSAATTLLLATLLAVWSVHAMAGLVLTGTLLLHAAMRARREPWAALALAAVCAISLALALPYSTQFTASNAQGGLDLPAALDDVRLMGVALLALAAVGTFALALRPNDRGAAVGVALAAALVALGGLVLARSVFGSTPFHLYDRSVTLIPILAAPLAGAGSAFLVAMVARRASGRAAFAVIVAGSLLTGTAAAFEARDQFDRPYYQVMSPAQQAAYEEAAPRLEGIPGYALVDGISTMAFTDITGRATLFVWSPDVSAPPPFVQRFFEEGASDTYLLVTSGTTIVVTDRPVTNPQLHPVAPGVYVLDDALVARMFR